jgi:hypothetical protein
MLCNKEEEGDPLVFVSRPTYILSRKSDEDWGVLKTCGRMVHMKMGKYSGHQQIVYALKHTSTYGPNRFACAIKPREMNGQTSRCPAVGPVKGRSTRDYHAGFIAYPGRSPKTIATFGGSRPKGMHWKSKIPEGGTSSINILIHLPFTGPTAGLQLRLPTGGTGKAFSINILMHLPFTGPTAGLRLRTGLRQKHQKIMGIRKVEIGVRSYRSRSAPIR